MRDRGLGSGFPVLKQGLRGFILVTFFLLEMRNDCQWERSLGGDGNEQCSDRRGSFTLGLS